MIGFRIGKRHFWKTAESEQNGQKTWSSHVLCLPFVFSLKYVVRQRFDLVIFKQVYLVGKVYAQTSHANCSNFDV